MLNLCVYKDSKLNMSTAPYCEVCLQNKSNDNKAASFRSLADTERIWVSVSMGFITHLPVIRSGWDAINSLI